MVPRRQVRVLAGTEGKDEPGTHKRCRQELESHLDEVAKKSRQMSGEIARLRRLAVCSAIADLRRNYDEQSELLRASFAIGRVFQQDGMFAVLKTNANPPAVLFDSATRGPLESTSTVAITYVLFEASTPAVFISMARSVKVAAVTVLGKAMEFLPCRKAGCVYVAPSADDCFRREDCCVFWVKFE